MARDVVTGLEEVVVLWCCCADLSSCRVPGAWVDFRISCLQRLRAFQYPRQVRWLGFATILSSCLATPISMSAVLGARGVIVSPSSDKRRGKAAKLSRFFKIHT